MPTSLPTPLPLTDHGDMTTPEPPSERLEDRFRALTASAPVGIYELTTDGALLYANERCGEIVGMSPARAAGFGWMEAIHPDDRERVVAEWAAARREDREFQQVYRFLHDDGDVVWVVGRATGLLDESGELVGLLGTLTDISDRRRDEQALAMQAEVMRNMAEGVYVIRAADRTIVFANPRFEAMTGYGPGELDGRPASVLYPPARSGEEEVAERIIAKLERDGLASYEVRALRKDGTEVWCRATTSTFEHAEHGEVWVTVQEDITEQRLARQAASEAEERFRRAFEDSATGMALIEGRGEDVGKFREVNQALSSISGYSPEELGELRYWSLVHPDDRPAMQEGVLRMIGGEADNFQAELRMLAKGEVTKWIAFNVSLLRDDSGEPVSAVAQAQDVTERKRFEAELRYLADHDPLTGLFNRRRFASELDREVSAAARYRAEGSLLVLDLDNFKLVNDSLGHAAGDELLSGVATAIRGRLRGSDIVARLGGDEFGIILPRADRDRAVLVAASLREVVHSVAASQAGGAPVTASVGIASFGAAPEDGQGRGVERVVGDADAAMYEAKQAGRDRVRVYSAGESRAALRSLS